MDEHYEQMITEAHEKFGTVFPCGNKTDLMGCFTYELSISTLMFWFNIAGEKTTRIITRKVIAKE